MTAGNLFGSNLLQGGGNASLNLYGPPAAALLSPPGAPWISGPAARPSPYGSSAARTVAGTIMDTFGSRVWFIHTHTVPMPATFALGLVLSTITRQLEVFNGRRSGSETLAAPVIAPSGTGLTLTGNEGSDPYTLHANSSRLYTLTADGTAGSTVILATITIDGTNDDVTILVTGTRMVVFASAIDWDGGFDERLAYLTDILPGYSDSEQRRILRDIARPGARFIVKSLTQRETQNLLSALWVGQAKAMAIPWWCDETHPTAPVSAGAITVAVDTTNRPHFIAGEQVLLWKDANTWEAIEIDTVGASSIGLTSPTQGSYSLADKVVPLKRGRIKEAVQLGEIVRDYASFEVDATAEVA